MNMVHEYSSGLSAKLPHPTPAPLNCPVKFMTLLESVGLRPSRTAMERALDKVDWGSITDSDDVFEALFTAAFR